MKVDITSDKITEMIGLIGMTSTTKAIVCLSGLSQNLIRSDEEIAEIQVSKEEAERFAIKADTKIIHMRGDEVIPQYSLIEIGDRGYADIAYGDVPNIGVAGELLTAKYIELSDNGTWVNSDGERDEI